MGIRKSWRLRVGASALGRGARGRGGGEGFVAIVVVVVVMIVIVNAMKCGVYFTLHFEVNLSCGSRERGGIFCGVEILVLRGADFG